jgi:phage recombination protein Bet
MNAPTPHNTTVAKRDEKMMEYVPFGAEDKIKLSIAMVQNIICIKTKSGKTCSETEALKFMMMCQARRLNPYEGDAFLIGYDGRDGASFSLITAHQAFLKRAEVNPEYDGMRSGIIIDRNGELMDLEGDFFLTGDKVLGGWATVFFKNRKNPMHKRIRLQRFQKSFGVWQDDAAGMICKCAEADALRSSFPTMLGGMFLREEMEARKEVTTSSPIFKAEVTEVVPSPLVVTAPEETPAEKIRKLMEKDKIRELVLIEWLESIGQADKDHKTLEEVFATYDTAAELVLSQWDEDLIKKLKN